MNLETINGTKRITGTADDKARRVLNTSHKQANITAEEIEAGITSERLDTIGVPVYRYATCVTIHGQLPDFNPKKRVGGYKSLSQNQNGTLGVRYIAIDAQKKKTILRRAAYGVKKYHVSLSSSEYSISKCFGEYTAENLATAKEELSKVPTNFTGTAYLGVERMPWGGIPRIYLDISLGAIPAGEVDKFSEFITGLPVAELDAKQKAKEEEYAAERMERDKQLELREKARAEKYAELDAMGLGVYTAPGKYERFFVDYDTYDGPFLIKKQTVEIKKHGKGYKVSFPKKPGAKGTIQDAQTVQGWQMRKVE